jgi:quercetin dioxygenase-like cupin family protein
MIWKKEDQKVLYPAPGIMAQSMAFADMLHIMKFSIKKGAVMPTHSHQQEQAGYLCEGKIIMTIDGVDHEIDAGDAWAIKANVTHSIKVIEDGTIVEVFSSIRYDYLIKPVLTQK